MTNELKLQKLQETHVPFVKFHDDNYEIDNDRHHKWLFENIGKEVYYVLNIGGPNFLTRCLGRKEEKEEKIVTKIRIGNYRIRNKIYLDVPYEIHDKYYELRIYPSRFGIEGYPLKKNYSRIMLGIDLAMRIGTFYIPRVSTPETPAIP